MSLIKEIRISFPEKTIWLYTGYKFEDLINGIHYPLDSEWEDKVLRQSIVKLCDVLVDGEYIDEQKDLSLRFRGSKNQRVIDVKQSLAQNKVVLYCN